MENTINADLAQVKLEKLLTDFHSRKELSLGFLSSQLKERLELQIAKYGKISYAYAAMNKKNTDNIVIITDLAEDVVNTYLNNKYQNIDPIITKALNSFTSFIWDENLKINSYWPIDKAFVVNIYDFQCGHTFVLHDNYHNLATLTLYYDKFLMADIGETIQKYKNDIHGLLLDTHEILLAIYKTSEEMSVDKTALSTREAEVLYWSSAGMTYAEVAETLKLTVSTVKFHMANTVKKLGVKNAKHAISLANELKLIPRSVNNTVQLPPYQR